MNRSGEGREVPPLPANAAFDLLLSRRRALASNRFIIGLSTGIGIVFLFLAYTALVSPRLPETLKLGFGGFFIASAVLCLALPHLNLRKRGRMIRPVPKCLSISTKGIEVEFISGRTWLLAWDDPNLMLRFDEWHVPRKDGWKAIKLGQRPTLIADESLYHALLAAAQSRDLRRADPSPLTLRDGWTRISLTFYARSVKPSNLT